MDSELEAGRITLRQTRRGSCPCHARVDEALGESVEAYKYYLEEGLRVEPGSGPLLSPPSAKWPVYAYAEYADATILHCKGALHVFTFTFYIFSAYLSACLPIYSYILEVTYSAICFIFICIFFSYSAFYMNTQHICLHVQHIYLHIPCFCRIVLITLLVLQSQAHCTFI